MFMNGVSGRNKMVKKYKLFLDGPLSKEGVWIDLRCGIVKCNGCSATMSNVNLGNQEIGEISLTFLGKSEGFPYYLWLLDLELGSA